MDTNYSDKRISDSMEEALNKQMNAEAEQAQAYLALGVWADSNYAGIADFFYKHSEEEREHMFKFWNTLTLVGVRQKSVRFLPQETTQRI